MILDRLRLMNEAAALLGAEPLESMEDSTPGGQSADLLFEAEISFMIGVYPFSFAKQLFELSRDVAVAPFSGFSYVFQLPPERLGPPLRVTDDATDPCRAYVRYVLIGEKVHASDDPLFVEVKVLPEPRLFSATFRKAAVVSLAADLALGLVSDKDLHKILKEEAFGSPSMIFRGGIFGAAIQEDARATPPKRAMRDGGPLLRAWQSS